MSDTKALKISLTECKRHSNWQSKELEKSADLIESLQLELSNAKNLLSAIPSNYCPQCGDGSGAYYDNAGEVCQCQWCDMRAKALPESES